MLGIITISGEAGRGRQVEEMPSPPLALIWGVGGPWRSAVGPTDGWACHSLRGLTCAWIGSLFSVVQQEPDRPIVSLWPGLGIFPPCLGEAWRVFC